MNIERAYDSIDEINAEDPNKITVNGKEWPVELIYGIRMTEEIESFMPEASDELKVAVRAQHIGRWTSPRSNYPMDKVGYMKWRTELYSIHAELASIQLRKFGLPEGFATNVSTYIREKAKRNSPETQIVEDVACLVFLRWYFEEFMEKHEHEKLLGIVRKTWAKMSDKAHERALTIPFTDSQFALVKEALGL